MWQELRDKYQDRGLELVTVGLDALGADELESAAALGDASAFGRAKGVGPKLAGRLASELKDKPPPIGRAFTPGFSVAAHAGLASKSSDTPSAEK